MKFLKNGDLKFFYTGPGPGKIRVNGFDLLRDPTFENMVLICLLTDQRADSSDELPAGEVLKRGWWGDKLLNFKIGSKLWLLERSKINQHTLAMAEQYTVDALEPLKQEGITNKVTCKAAYGKGNQINFLLQIFKADGIKITFKFFINWKLQLLGGLT